MNRREDAAAARRSRAIDLALWLLVGATLAGAGTTFEPAAMPPALLLAAGVGFAVLVGMRTWCRRHNHRVVAGAVWAAQRERTEALASAERHAAHWQAIVDTATEGIVTIDSNGTIESVNGAAQRLFGYAATEMIGRNVRMLMPEPYRSAHDSYMRRYLETGEKRIIGIGREVVGVKQDGSQFPIDLSVGEGRTAERRFFTAVIRDVTERKEMQLKLAQTERLAAVGELAAGVAHEINNPINTVLNCAQLIRDGDDATENCAVIQEEAERIADIVRDLLQFSRDDRDSTCPTSLAEVVARALRLIGENWKRHAIVVDCAVPEELPAVQARPQQLQQVLLNLLINAKDALLQVDDRPRTVAVTAREHGDGVELEVRDNGPGIPPELGTRVFEPFVTTKRARGGTGLGLSISKGIVESYGGTIGVSSEPGQGATFSIWLKRAVGD
ncbi:MAG: PAS domain S-box protein [Planctomycetes bacterium]|nr:PAS domain S-box protein [Planctomycetota bacterium]